MRLVVVHAINDAEGGCEFEHFFSTAPPDLVQVTPPCIPLHLPVSPCIPLYLHVSPCISLYLTVSPCVSLYLPVSPCISQGDFKLVVYNYTEGTAQGTASADWSCSPG